MTRAPEGALVNLTPATVPEDVYATVAKRALERVTADTTRTGWGVDKKGRPEDWKGNVARLALAYGIDRKVCKRNVMTFCYSSKKFGMGAQLQTELMDVLDEEVLTGKRDEHPFAPYHEGHDERPSAAARYLADHVYESIVDVIKLPAGVMKFLQTLAKAMAHEGRPLSWTTPAGLPWINRYHETNTRAIDLYLHDVRIQIKMAIGDAPEINKEKAAAGVSPNFVHALDAAHLMLTANACAREGITSIATVHDSFGCLAPRAKRFNQIIREQFVEMYTKHDVLAEVLGQAKHDLTEYNWNRLPELPERGSLDLEGVKNAQFAFA
jgi:DNA-directed RNA polymerase